MPSGDLHREIIGSGPRVVLVHGFTQTGRSWRSVAADLARDHEVVLVDAPGHGGSAGVHADLVSGTALLGAAGGQAVYVGYSMGGRLVLHLALARPELVRALVVVSATAGIEDATDRARRREADDELARRLEAIGLDAFLDEWLRGPLFARLTPDAADLPDRRRNTVAGLASSLHLAGTGTQEPLWSRLPELSMPALVLAGSADERFAAIGRRMAAAIGPSASYDEIAGAGHAAHLERPDAIVRVLRRWLQTTEATSA
jgi:2-succinyl-6-hydroxy-2,4-cyclohexadiene-1-carboxylate synthase